MGILGTDSVTRSLENLVAKLEALEDEGITTYMWTGAYRMPPVTLTGSVQKDMCVVKKVIGVGEVAISDHRGSQPSVNEIAHLVSDAR